VLVGLELALALAVALALLLGLLPGLAAMNASREAETVAVGELCDDDGDAEPVWDGEPEGDVVAADGDGDGDDDDDDDDDDGDDGDGDDGDGDDGDDDDGDDDDGDDDDGDDDDGDDEPDPALALDGDGESGVLLEVLSDAGAVGEAEVDDEEGDGGGDGDFVGETVGVGVGVDVLAAGSTAHLVSVFALVLADVLALALADVLALMLADVLALMLADVLALGEAAPAVTVPARAAPGQPASTPRVMDPPASRPSTAARTCARRMKIALSTLLIEVTVCSLWDSEATG
jgi:hypothetical protein